MVSFMVSSLLAGLLSVGFSAELPAEKDVPVLDGKYVYHHNYTILRKTEAYTIPSDDPNSENLVNKLLGEGFRCNTQSDDSFICWKESAVDQRDSEEVRELVAERCKAESLDFRAVYDPTEGVHNSSFLRTFKVFQKVIRTSPTFDDEIVSEILYSWNSVGRWWVTFPGNETSFTYDIAPDGKSLTRFLTVEKNTESPLQVKAKRSYQVRVNFEHE